MRVSSSAIIAIVFACGPAGTLPRLADSDFCYEARYQGAGRELHLMPIYFALRRGERSGVVESKSTPADTIGFWRMFQNREAHWTRGGDKSIQLSFTNGFTGVSYELVPRDSELVGKARIDYDFGDPAGYPQFRVQAVRVDCSLVN